jgi:hypothetical protein
LKPLTDFSESTDSCFATGLPRVVVTVSGESNDYFAGGCLALKKDNRYSLLFSYSLLGLKNSNYLFRYSFLAL